MSGFLPGELTAHLQPVPRVRMRGVMSFPFMAWQELFFLHPVSFGLIYVNFSSTPRSPKWCSVTFRRNWSFRKVSCCSRSKIEATTPMSRNSYGWGFASFSLCMCSLQRALLMALVFRYHIQHSAVTGRFICYVTLLGAAWLLQLQ